MRQNSVDNKLGLAELLSDFAADFHVRAFHLMVNCLADIMQQTCTLSKHNVYAQLRSHHACQVCNLNRVVQHILTIAGAIFQTAQKLNQLRMQAMHANRKGCLLASLLNLLLNLFLSLLDHFFNTGRMNTTVVNQLFQSNAGNLAAHRIKAGNNNCLRSIVDNQVNAGQSFQSADIATLATDNAALHLIIRQTNNGNGGLSDMVSSAALNCQRDNLASLSVSIILSLLLQLLDHHCGIMLNLIFERLQQLLLCLVTCQTGDTLQLYLTFLQQGFSLILSSVQSLLLRCQLLFLAFEGLHFSVQVFFLLLQTALLTLQVTTSVFIFTFHFRT